MEYKKIKELVKVNSENIDKKFNKEQIYYLDTSNITRGKIENIVEYNIKDTPSRAKRIVRKNDIIYSTVRPNLCHYGLLRNIPNNLIVSTGFIVLRCDENQILPEYLYAYLSLPNITQKMHSIAETSTSTYPSIKPSDLEEVIIPVPNINEQQKIANILSNIDKKIELNNQINDNLYELCKNLYKNYFIDNINSKWIVDKLGNYLTIDRGLSYKGKFLSDVGTPMINLGNVMPNGIFRIEKSKYYTGEYKDKVTAKVGDIVIANTDMTQNREVIGTPVIIPPLYDSDIIFSHHIYCLRNLKLPKMYLFYTLLTDEWNGVAGGNATGTTVLALPKETIENYKINIPDEITLNNFENVAMKIQQQRDNTILENINLEQLRDTLLPKLMNGEIDLENIEI